MNSASARVALGCYTADCDCMSFFHPSSIHCVLFFFFSSPYELQKYVNNKISKLTEDSHALKAP